jgi:hypothetical protein
MIKEVQTHGLKSVVMRDDQPCERCEKLEK